MSQTTETQNKAIVLEAFDTLFNKRETAPGARGLARSSDGSRGFQTNHCSSPTSGLVESIFSQHKNATRYSAAKLKKLT